MANAMDPAAPSPEHLAQLDAARLASKKIRRAVSYAQFDGWTIAAFAASSLVVSFTSVTGILLGLAMAYVAWQELSNAAAFRRLEVGAARRLANNQYIFCGVLTLYFAWSLYQSITAAPDPTESELGISPDLIREGSILAYLGLIFASILFQGGTAWYYLKRGRVLEQYLINTPQWIIDYQRGGGTL